MILRIAAAALVAASLAAAPAIAAHAKAGLHVAGPVATESRAA